MSHSPDFARISTLRAIAFALTLAVLLAFSQASQAQVPSNNEEGTVIYPAEYFDQWTPITAQDMLERIPGQENSGPRGGGGGPPGGFGGNPTSGGRGLGGGNSGTEILVNGKRTAGKNNQTQGLLSRIAADQVQEIQVIRGTSGDLDVRGSSQVVNVILFEELSSTSVSYTARVEHIQDDQVNVEGVLAVSGQAGPLDYLIDVRSSPRYRNNLANESSILGDFTPNDTIVSEDTSDSRSNQISTNIGYEFSTNSSLRLNGLYEIWDGENRIDRVTTDLLAAPDEYPYLVERELNPTDRTNWELGGDYEYFLDNGDRFKLLAIANERAQDRVRQRFEKFPDNTEQKNLFLGVDSTTQERIVRASYTTDIFDQQSVEFGVEGAQTILDSSLSLGLLTSGTPSEAVGGLVPQNVSNASSEVEEIRYEPFVIHNWTLNPKMTLESTLVWETSEISQSGDVTRSRDFDFIKPKFDLRYNVSPALQLRGTIERIVNQLSFSDFVASNDEQDLDSDTIAGNADLRQQTQWRYTFNTEYRFPNDVGVINTELFYADHQDVIDWIDTSADDSSLRSTNGNIGDGKEIVLNINASIRAAMIGLPNLLVSPGLNLQDSEVTDPFLGIQRRFRSYQRGRFTLTFRHDIPQYGINWGMQYFDRIDGNMFAYDIGDIEFTVGEPRYNLFAEYRDRAGITYRLDVGGLTDGSQCRERWRYVGRIVDNVLEELEYRCNHGGVETQFRINGTF